MDANPGLIQTIVKNTLRQGWLIGPARAVGSSWLKLPLAARRRRGTGRSSGGAGARLLTRRVPVASRGSAGLAPGHSARLGWEAHSATCRGRAQFSVAELAFRLPRAFPPPSRRRVPVRADRTSDADLIAAARARLTDHDAVLRDAGNRGRREDDGPPEGLTLDRAIDITLERSLDLRSKFMEIPMARADTLQASLRSNPIFYQDGQLLQYGGTSTKFTRSAPGGPSQFDTNVSYPLDISHKRQARTMVAARAERVLEALYQDAVRQRIDDVYGAYVAALAARQTVRLREAKRRGD